jgi:UbiD family decarboxylase
VTFSTPCKKRASFSKSIATSIRNWRLRKSASVSGLAIVFKTNGTAFPSVGGVYNTRAKALIELQTTEKDVFDRVLRGMSNRIPPVVVTDAPVHENVLTGDAIDTSRLPVAKYSPDDGGRYITAGIVVSKDSDTGIPVSGIIASKSLTSRP